MLIVIGSAPVSSDRRETFVQATTAVTHATRNDDGCLSYGFYADLSDPKAALSVEIWRDQAALDAHMNHTHTREFLAAVPNLVVGTPSMTTYEVL